MAGEDSKFVVEFEVDSSGAIRKTKAFKKEIEGLGETAKKQTKPSGGMGMLGTAFKRLAAYGAAGIVIRGVKKFVSDSVKMASSLEGIERQFRIATSQGQTSLQELRDATKGTVSDFKLMEAAVRADTFNLPLSKMADLFEFARIRASQTGDSVEYLTDSIVLGLGRKSPLILDNLGITMIRLKEAMGGTIKSSTTSVELMEAMVKVAKQDTEILKLLGETSLTTSQKVDKLNASISSIKENLGKSVIESSAGKQVTSMMDFISEGTRTLSGQEGGFLESIKLIALTLQGNTSAVDVYTKALQRSKEEQRLAAINTKEYTAMLKRLVPETKGVANSTDDLQRIIAKSRKEIDKFKDLGEGAGYAYTELGKALTTWSEAQKRSISGTVNSRKELATLTDIKLKYGDALKTISYQLKWNGQSTNELKEKQKALINTLISLEETEVSSSKAIAEKSALLKQYGNDLEFVNKELDKMKKIEALNIKDKLGLDSLGTGIPKPIVKMIETLREANKGLDIKGDMESASSRLLPENANEKGIQDDYTQQNVKIAETRSLVLSLGQAFQSAASSSDEWGDILEAVLKRLALQLASMAASAAIIALLFPNMIPNNSFGERFKGLISGGDGGGVGFAGKLFNAIFSGGNGAANISGAAAGNVAGSRAINVNVTGSLRGNDIALAGSRGSDLYGRRLG